MVVPVALGMLARRRRHGERRAERRPPTATTPVLAIVPLIFFLGFIGIVAFIVVRAIGSFGKRWELWVRMDRFARQNGMTFSPLDAQPSYPGAIFQLGDARQSVDHLVSSSGRFFDFGNYRYTTGSGKNRSTRTWGFLAFNLDRKLPHMVLDSKANNGFFGTNLPATFDKDQILSLEGDFDKYFTLYCPKQYERDALYVFTPDLMALLIDEAAPFDVEIVDDWMFVYSNVRVHDRRREPLRAPVPHHRHGRGEDAHPDRPLRRRARRRLQREHRRAGGRTPEAGRLGGRDRHRRGVRRRLDLGDPGRRPGGC